MTPPEDFLIPVLYSSRNIPLFAIVAAPLLAQYLNDLFITSTSQLKFLNYLKNLDTRLFMLDRQLTGAFWPVFSILIAIIGLGLGFHFDMGGEGYAFDSEIFPVEAVDWIEDNPQEGEMFNYFTWGGYLLYRQWPVNRVFIDGQTDFYGETLTRQYLQVMEQQDGWEDVIDKYHVGWVILPADSFTEQEIQEELKWKIVYKDSTAVILHK